MAVARTQEITTYLSRGPAQESVNAELLAAYTAFACAQVCGSESVELKAQGEEGKDSLPRAEVGARSKANPNPSLGPSPNPQPLALTLTGYPR